MNIARTTVEQLLSFLSHAARDASGDLRYALRMLRWQPGFTAVAVLSLAIGIGFNTAVFSIINTIFFQTLHGVADVDRMAYIGSRHAYAAFRDVRDGLTTVSDVAAWQPMQVDIRYRDVAMRRVVPAVSTNYFEVLGVRPHAGRFFDPARTARPSDDAVVVVDFEFWEQTLGADPAAIGRTLTVGGVSATIVGVAPRAFHGVERAPLWVPMGLKPAIERRQPRWDDAAENGWRLIGRMRDGVSLEQVEAELALLAARTPERFPDVPRVSNGRERWTGSASREKQIEFLLVVVMPLVVVGLILWIGCSNVANLLLARAVARRKEIAVRLATGATRSRVIRLLLTESLLLSALGGAAGLLVASWTLDFAWATLPEFSVLAVEIDSRVLVYTAAISVLATMLFGAAPAIHSARLDVAPLLKGDGAGQRAVRGTSTRTFFLITQFAASMAVLLVAGTFVRAVIASHIGPQSAHLDRLALAYAETAVESTTARQAHWARLREAVQQQPGVAAVSLLDPAERTFRLTAADANRDHAAVEIAVQQIDEQLLDVVGAAVVAGSAVALPRPNNRVEPVALNERAASQLAGGSAALDREFTLEDIGMVRVAGIVRDGGDRPRLYRFGSNDTRGDARILVRTTGPSADAVPALRDVLARLSDERGFTRVSTLREATLGGLTRLTRLALAIAAIVMLLASAGLYGSISFFVSQRTREIAVRSALGAPGSAVLGLLAREGIRVVGAGSVLGLLLTGIAFQFMSGMLFPVWTLSPALVAGVASVFTLASVAACYVPARRALSIAPMELLKSE
jgi:putative ABC transport system permease protein